MMNTFFISFYIFGAFFVHSAGWLLAMSQRGG